MTERLLTCMLATAALTAVASPRTSSLEGVPDNPIVTAQIKTTELHNKDGIINTNQSNRGEKFQIAKCAQGHNLKSISKTGDDTMINPILKRTSQKTAGNGIVLSEEFEDWDGKDTLWLPEKFSRLSLSGREDVKSWYMISEDNVGGLDGLTGNMLLLENQPGIIDEWIVFPEVTLGNDMLLSFSTLNEGIWYFSLENIDWDSMQYIGDKIPIYDQKVMISEDGGENWEEVKSLIEDFADYDLEDLNNMYSRSVHTIQIPLSDYNGKTVKLAYRCVGINQGATFLDNIKIGYPEMEVNYSNPLGTLFFGMSPESNTLSYSVLAGPVYKPWTFYNNSYAEGATYSWEYFNSDSEWAYSDEQDALEVTYHTDYTDDFTTRNNWYYTPILTGTAPGYSDGTYTRGLILQAGGKGEFVIAEQNGDKRLLNLGLGVIDPTTEGYTEYTDNQIPLFGYNADVEKYWNDYTFGDESDENNYVHYNGFLNLFYNHDTPIVIKGLHVPTFANLSDGAVMKAEIVMLSDEGVPSEEACATAYCEYKDMTIYPLSYTKSYDYVSLNFKFDEPVVMSSDVCMAYVVRISGFSDPDHVEYFNPIMSETDNPDGYAHGWIEKTIVFDGNEPRLSFTPVAYYFDEERYVSFYIMLEAEYPWLEGPESVNIEADGIGEVTLDSSVPGEELLFENLPDWLSAKAEGKYGDTKITFQATPSVKSTATVTVTAPGVSHDIIVNADGGSVSGIGAESGHTDIYNISGTRVSGMNSAGIYIVKDSAGNVKKTVKH